MKFSPSSSISSSSSPFTDNLCTSKSNAFGCFITILTRILCSKTLPTYPSDPTEFDPNPHFSKLEEKTQVLGSRTPNVVARLMGLDSIPNMTSDKIGTIQRSAKAPGSIREVPEYFELEDDEFFILSFEKRGQKQNHRKKRDHVRKQRRIIEKEKETVKVSPLKDEISGKKEGLNGKKARKQSKDEVEFKEEEFSMVLLKDEVVFDSENLSPVSVLDHGSDSENISDFEVTTSEEDARFEGSENVTTDYSSQSQSSQTIERNTNGNEEQNLGLKRRNYKKYKLIRDVSKLAEEEVNNSYWNYTRMLKGDELEDIVKDFGQGIFDQLVSELLDQLVGFECQKL